MPPRFFKSFHFLAATLPAIYLALVILYDWLEPFRTVTPPLCAIGLMTMSVYLIPQWMYWWSFVYSAVVAEALLNQRFFAFLSNGYHPPEITSHKFRVLGFCCTALFCCVFSYLLTKLRNQRTALNNLISRMPLPVIVSDPQGQILILNEKARYLLNVSEEEQNIERNYFDLLASKSHQGRFIADYINIFEQSNDLVKQIELEIKEKPISATIELMESEPKLLITMIPLQSG